MNNISRRHFLEAGIAAAVLHPLAGRGQDAVYEKPKIKIGLIGAGGRGSWIAKLFQEHENPSRWMCPVVRCIEMTMEQLPKENRKLEPDLKGMKV